MRTYDLIDDAFKALEHGQIEAVINDFPCRSTPSVPTRTSWSCRRYRPRSTGSHSRRAPIALRNAVNEQLAKIKDDGELAKISSKWLGSRPCGLH